MQCTDTVRTGMYFVHNDTSCLIRPDHPCDAGESQLRSGAAPSEQPSSCHQSFQLTDHPAVACHGQTATATGLPHTHCSHAGHLLLQCHSCPERNQTSCAGCTCEEWLGSSYQPGTRGSVELCPPYWLLEPNTGRVLAWAQTTWSLQHAPLAR